MIGIIKKIKKQQVGFTIAEVVVAVTIFSVIMVIAIDSFISVINVNRESRQYQALQDHARFLYEMMSKELRMAQVNIDGRCNPDHWGYTMVYNPADSDSDGIVDSIYFKNYDGECVRYYLADENTDGRDELYAVRGNSGSISIMPSSLEVADLSFDVTNFEHPEATNNPPSVTFYMKLKSDMWNPPQVELQTTITARYIE